MIIFVVQKKIPDPCFNVVSENVLETVQKGPHSFKKVGVHLFIYSFIHPGHSVIYLSIYP